MAGFHLAGASDHLTAFAEDTANSRVKSGPWAVGQQAGSPFASLDNSRSPRSSISSHVF